RSSASERKSSANFLSAAASQIPDSRNLFDGQDREQSDLNGEENSAGSPSSGFFRSPGRSESEPSEARQNLNALASALLGLGVNRLAQYVDSLLPGFHGEFERAKAERRETGLSQSSHFRRAAPNGANVRAADPAGPTN